MKKTLALLLLAAALLVSCGDASDDAQDTSADTNGEVTTAEENSPENTPETIPETAPETTEAPETDPPEPYAVEVVFRVFEDSEIDYIWDEMGSNEDTSGNRYHDLDRYIVYELPTGWNNSGTLSILLKNEFELSISADGDEFEVIASSTQTGGPNKPQEYDLSKYMTGEYVYVRIGDADPSDGYGGLIPKNTDITFTAPAPAAE